MMTQEEAKQSIRAAYCHFDDSRNAMNIVIDQIYNGHEAIVKVKDNEISALKAQQTALYDILKALQEQPLYDVLYRSDK